MKVEIPREWAGCDYYYYYHYHYFAFFYQPNGAFRKNIAFNMREYGYYNALHLFAFKYVHH